MFKWAEHQQHIEDAADFFLANVDASYISHGEVQSGRALDMSTWSEDARKILISEFGKCLKPDSNHYLGIASQMGKLTCLTYIQVVRTRKIRFAILEDIVTSKELRGQGIGTALYSWIEDQMKLRGVTQMFLETGLHNSSAHPFLVARGYEDCSLVMTKRLK